MILVSKQCDAEEINLKYSLEVELTRCGYRSYKSMTVDNPDEHIFYKKREDARK